MFDSKSLLSSKGPLGAIWVAAYFFKRLKKAQVLDTDISFSVDKLILDESEAITYRVLGYLLLGIVRVFSRKIDYLFDDCNEVLFRINDFVVKTKKKKHSETMKAPYFLLTVPEKFELDTFDLEIHEDNSSNNVLPNEDITLKDVEPSNEEKTLCSLITYHYEETYAGCSTSSTNYTLVEDCVPSCQMDVDMELQTSNDRRSFDASMGKEQENRFTQEECVDLEMLCVVEEQPLCSIKPYGKDHQANGQEKDLERSQSEFVEEEGSIEKLRDSSFDQEKGVNLVTSCGIEGESPEQNKISNSDHHVDEDEMFVSEFTVPVNKSSQVKNEDQDVSNLPTEMENLPDCTHSEIKFVDLDVPYTPNEPLELDTSFGKENLVQREQRSQEMLSSEKRKCHMAAIDYPVSITLDVTPFSNAPDATDSTTPQFMGIPTPAARERCEFSRKRKSLIDDVTVLTNEVMRQSINDTGDLVSKRRKVPHTASLAAWKACRIRNLSHGFFDSLVSGLPQELKSCFCNKKLKIMESDKTVQPPEKLQVSMSPCPSKPDQIAIAPQTPVRSTTLIKSFESPWSPKALDRDQSIPEQYESIEKEVRSEPFESVDKEPSLFREEEFEFNETNETNEEINCFSEYSHDLHISRRTRVVMRYLHDSFLNKKKQGKEEVVNLVQVLEGNTQKSSAGFFYEILVLKTKGYVDVKQDDAYGDILAQKLPKWEEICVDGRF